MKQARHAAGLGIYTRQICPLVQIAVNTRHGKVLEIITAAVNPWNYVLDMKRRQWGISLKQPTVLATIARALSNAGSGRRVHHFCLVVIRWRACRWRIATN